MAQFIQLNNRQERMLNIHTIASSFNSKKPKSKEMSGFYY